MRTLFEQLEFVLTVDENDRVIKEAAVVIEDDKIIDLDRTDEIASRHRRDSFDKVYDCTRKGMCPGFVDSHVHMSETLSRAVFPDDINTRTWVFHWGKPFYSNVNAEDEYVSVLLGCTEMLRNGTTCFLDMGAQNDVSYSIKAMEKSGIRGITGRHAADNPPDKLPDGWTEEMVAHHFFPNLEVALETLRETVNKWNNSADGRIRCWANIEGKEPCTMGLHVGARALAEELGVGTTYHLASSIEEARVSERKYGKWPVQRVADEGGIGSNLVIAHGVALTDEEVRLIAETDTKIAFCPGTSLKIAKGATNIGKYPELLGAGVTIGLGTDGVSAAGNLDLMRQMYLVAGLFKDARMDPTLVGSLKALRMATIEGARVLGWDDEIGSLEVGKKADFVLFDLGDIEWIPYADPTNALVWSASPRSISETWVNGQAVFKEGKTVQIDEDDLRKEAVERAASIIKSAGLEPDSGPRTTTLYD